MHLYVVIAFALLIWWTRDLPFDPPITSPSATWLFVIGQLVLIHVIGTVSVRRAYAAFHDPARGPGHAQRMHHKTLFLIRSYVLGMFAADLAMTIWPRMVMGCFPIARIPALGEFIVVVPFLAGVVLSFWVTYPIDVAIRRFAAESSIWQAGAPHHAWTRREYMDFNIRHQLLSVVVPMGIILLAHGVTREYESELEAILPLPWISDVALGVAAAGVFVIAPWLLRRIWTTQPLPPGKLRTDLERICKRIGLKCRDILIWNSGGMYVNAAVMGLFAPVRYVLLSDGLLESMNDRQIGAVFGHEAGHVRHRHIPFFLLFALASMLISSGVMELLYRGLLRADGTERLGPAAVQGIGFVVIICLWAVGFGFISRRFERQADLFGAQCVTPDRSDECLSPCSVHGGDVAGPSAEQSGSSGRLCATGAGIFASALDRVALLNGIGHDEPSWRHSSIASRIAFLHRLSSDPLSIRRFDGVIRFIKFSLIGICAVGLLISAWYLWPYWLAAFPAEPRP